jgi:hypothetical protein
MEPRSSLARYGVTYWSKHITMFLIKFRKIFTKKDRNTAEPPEKLDFSSDDTGLFI